MLNELYKLTWTYWIQFDWWIQYDWADVVVIDDAVALRAPFGPLECMVRQYLGFNDLVIHEYSELIEYDDPYLLGGKSNKIIAQWRNEGCPSSMPYIPYIYHFRYIFDKNWNCLISTSANEIISLPPKLYKDIVKCVI